MPKRRVEDVALNEKQKAFCEYYAACFNATEAAKKAGYSQKTARSIGQRLLTFVDVQGYLSTLQSRARANRIATIDEVMEYLSDTMRNKEERTNERTKAAQLLMDALSGREEIEGDSCITEIVIVPEDASGGERNEAGD